MRQLGSQEATFKVHQSIDEDVQQVLLSLHFECPNVKDREWRRRSRQNYHTLLLSMLVLVFFLILECGIPAVAQPPEQALSHLQQQPVSLRLARLLIQQPIP